MSGEKRNLYCLLVGLLIIIGLISCSNNESVTPFQGADPISTPESIPGVYPPNPGSSKTTGLPLIRINNVMYQEYDTSTARIAQKLDDTWVFVGKIESFMHETREPVENFQANTNIIGAEVYHSSEGSIVVNARSNLPLVKGEEFFGDSIIVVIRYPIYPYSECRQYIAQELFGEVYTLLSATADYGNLLYANENMYELELILSPYNPQDDGMYHTSDYLGEILGQVPENEQPLENFFVNYIMIGVGAKVYRLPKEELFENKTGYGNNLELVIVVNTTGYFM